MTRTRRTALRWLAPVLAAVVLIGAGGAVSALTNAARADLPPRSASTLLVDIQKARLTGLSGTIVQHADLGIPALPTSGGTGSSTSPASLVSGSHTLRVWYAGPERSRISLLGDYGESDLVKNGRSVWLWSSADKTATHWVLPAGTRHEPSTQLPMNRMTPQRAADAALKAISPSTKVTTNGTAEVAGRSAYLLALAPRSANTLVESVQVAIDGKTHVPTRVQVFAKGHTAPVFEVGFTSFDPHSPSSSVFGFNPPPGTKVTRKSLDSLAPDRSGRRAVQAAVPGSAPHVVGSGWSSVLVVPAPKQAKALTSSGKGLAAMVSKLPKVSGSWGSGRLLRGTVFSALLTDNGTLVVGAVPPKTLYAALGAR
ncbi:MAG: LolA family protein [Marmoricola sp.]